MSASDVNLFSVDIKFKDVIRHFRKMNREQIADDIEKTLDDLENLELDGDSFGSLLVRTAFNAREKRRAETAEFGKLGGRPKKSKSKSTEVVPVNGSKRNDQLIWGRFENVYLSQDEFNTLAKDFGNLNFLKDTIEAFSASLADGHTTSNNHFATLTRWIAARKRWKEDNKPHYESVNEHNRRVVEQSKRETQLLNELGFLK